MARSRRAHNGHAVLLLVSIDGMRPDGLTQAETPNMDRLIAEGSSTMTAQTLMPCCTLPCHTSMLRGVDVPRHGINTNTFHPIVRPVPSLIDLVALRGLRAGMFFNWAQVRDLSDPDHAEITFSMRDARWQEADDRIAEEAVRSFGRDSLDFAFVYFGHVDECGHEHGWMSEAYLKAIANADRCLGLVLEAAPGATVIVLSDHGGHERTHGTELPEDMTIPWIAAGPGVREGHAIAAPVTIHQTAATAAKLMGLPLPREWDGAPIDEIFV